MKKELTDYERQDFWLFGKVYHWTIWDGRLSLVRGPRPLLGENE